MRVLQRPSSRHRRRQQANRRLRSLDGDNEWRVRTHRSNEVHRCLAKGKNVMKVMLAGALMTVCGLLGFAGSAFAHHGFGVEFDGSKCMDLKGTLTGVLWENPHAYVQMDVMDASGNKVEWHLE